MSKIKLLTIAVIGLLIMNICVVGFLLLRKPPIPAEEMPREKPEGPREIIIEKLHFDKAQVAKYDQSITEHRTLVKALMDSISFAKNKLYESLKKESPNDKDSLLSILSVLQKHIETVHYEHFIQIKKLCRSEQIEAFNTLTGELANYFNPEKKDPPPAIKK